MKFFFKVLIFDVLIMSLLMCCTKIESYPNTPEVHFKSYTTDRFIDNSDNDIKLAEIIFSFVDGDGDIGLRQSDSLEPYVGKYKNNFFSSLYIKSNGKYIEVKNIFLSNYTIPYIEPKGQNKTLKADVKITFEYTNSDTLFNYDTLMYKYYIIDRALNQSNIDSTCDIVFKK
ncbi:MAG: hypothetical protein IMY72_07400 [Bacteroidetes bacterium]|nr:hypothetical protein [Bacteroidota bacterium]